ncbi:MAG: FecR family protein [Rhodospirillales bacterium]|nr:FecR family protein [Rhodospirillales bacterium]MDP6884145.1 FecR family protein [Rhodospirillales bacterium]
MNRPRRHGLRSPWIRAAAVVGVAALIAWIGQTMVLADEQPDENSLISAVNPKRPVASLGESQWAVVGVSGKVLTVRLDTETWRPVSAGTRLAPSTQLKTGPDGWALLVRGNSDITVKSDSHMAVPKQPRDPLATRILQSLGTLLLRVEKRPGQRFEVETPYLIAGVKGTTFSVSVENKGATVSVEEGTVGVSTHDGGVEVDVTIGRTASVSSAPGADVEIGPTPAGAGQAAGTGQPGRSQGAAPGQGVGKSAAAGPGSGQGGGNDGNNGGGNSGGNGGGRGPN